MVENASAARGAMPSLISDNVNPILSNSTPLRQPPKQGMKLEAVMEQLQKQQLAPQAAMEIRARQVRENHRLYVQQLAAQQAALVATSGRAIGSPMLGHLARVHQAVGIPRGFHQDSMNSESEEDDEEEDEEDDDDESLLDEETEQGDLHDSMDVTDRALMVSTKHFHVVQPNHRKDSTSQPPVPPQGPPPVEIKEELEDPPDDLSGSPQRHASWGMDEQLKQNENLPWIDDADARAREASRDFAKLYELDSDPERKEFLDDLFIFMQKKGTPISRIPIMAKQLLDLYMLYKLVTEKGGLVEVINKKIWREITKGLNLPTSITSAAFTLRTQYMKYLYHYECEKKSLSSPAELQAAIDGNRREGRRPSYTSALFSYSPSTSGPSSILSPPRIHMPVMGAQPSNTAHASPGATPKKAGDSYSMALSMPSRFSMPMALANQQAAVAARMATLEHLKERLGSGEPPEKRKAHMTDEEQRLIQQAFQHNLLNMARQIPMKLKLNGKVEEKPETPGNLPSSSIGSINMSIEINGTMYTGVLFAQKPVQLIAGSNSQSHSSSSSSHSPTSSRGTPGAEPSTSWSL
ncbi:AT-rich interactive domain-containing protein 3B [Ambystoma mexicanum]|uniref:AT-rich interactive domain-containing protein 3B n=1 Tax=Ambystoma mexicanum TaxID=8296 RepID=UPI0037E85CE3